MKLLAFSDLHRDRKRAERLVELAREADGSTSVLEVIEHRQPALVLCGHIHHCWGGEAIIGTTRVLNVGPEGRLLEI